jgi:hypothetical protein
MNEIGYGSSFNKSIQLEEGRGDNQNPLEVSTEKILDDIDTLVNTNDHYNKWGRNTIGRNIGSPIFYQKRSSTRAKPHDNSQEQRKYSTRNSYDGGDKHPSKRVIEIAHIFHVYTKVKIESVHK